MKSRPRRLILAAAVLTLVPLSGVVARMEQAPAVSSTRAVELEDIMAWKTIGATTVSNDGRWFAYRTGAGRRRRGDRRPQHRFRQGDALDAGELRCPRPGRGRRAGWRGGRRRLDDAGIFRRREMGGVHVVSRRAPRRSGCGASAGPCRAASTVVNLASGDKREYPKIRRFAFSGEASTWLALHRLPAQAAAGSGGGARRGDGSGVREWRAATSRTRRSGTDLILRELATGQELNVGNVSEFAFTRDGRLPGGNYRRAGQGRQRRAAAQPAAGTVTRARQRRGRLRAARPSPTRGTRSPCSRARTTARCATSATPRSAFTSLSAECAEEDRLRPSPRQELPGRHDHQRQPRSRGGPRISTRCSSGSTCRAKPIAPASRDAAADEAHGRSSGSPPTIAPAVTPPTKNADKVDLVLWHWQDSRLPTQQEVQESARSQLQLSR